MMTDRRPDQRTYGRDDIVGAFPAQRRDILHFMPSSLGDEKQINVLVAAVDDIFARGIADTTLRFVGKNLKQVFSHS